MTSIYHYHPETGDYLWEGQSEPSPVNSATLIIPAYATLEAPPKPPNGYKAVFDNGLWKTVKIKTS